MFSGVDSDPEGGPILLPPVAMKLFMITLYEELSLSVRPSESRSETIREPRGFDGS